MNANCFVLFSVLDFRISLVSHLPSGKRERVSHNRTAPKGKNSQFFFDIFFPPNQDERRRETFYFANILLPQIDWTNWYYRLLWNERNRNVLSYSQFRNIINLLIKSYGTLFWQGILWNQIHSESHRSIIHTCNTMNLAIIN